MKDLRKSTYQMYRSVLFQRKAKLVFIPGDYSRRHTGHDEVRMAKIKWNELDQGKMK